jgi:hypothetical protein
MKKVFLTFADRRMYRSAQRIKKQALLMGCYDEIVITDETDLDSGFINDMEDYLKPEVRGFGYWCWKPQIILQTLEKMNQGDLLQYTDVGCHLNPRGKSRLNDYFALAEKSEKGILAFQAKPPSLPFKYDGRPLLDLAEYKWTKGDLLEYFGVQNKPEVLSSQQIGSGIIFVKKCPQSELIIRQWLTAYERHFALADDSKSKSPNKPGFIEHRHDQSIFSILCKVHKVETLSSYEYWYPQRDSLRADWAALRTFPIHAKRDKDLGYLRAIFHLASTFRKKVLGGITNE